MAKNLTKAQQKKLELLKAEQDLNKSLLSDAEEFVNLGGKLTELQQEHIKNLQVDKTLRGEAADLEADLTKQIQSGNAEKSKQGELGKGMLDSLKASLKSGDISVDQFKSQAELVGKIASGQMDSVGIQEAMVDLGGDMTEEMYAYLEAQKRSNKAQELGKNAASAMDDILGGMGSTIKNFLTNPLTIVAGLLTALSAGTDEIGGKFGAIGATDFRKELGATRVEFVGMGLEASEALDVVSTLSNEFGIGFEQAMGMADEVGNLAKSTGMATGEAANLIGMLTVTQGLSAEAAMDMSKQTVALAKSNNVAPDQVLKDIAGSAETFAKFSSGGAEGLMKAAIQARKLGVDLNSVAESAEKSLDFQSSLEAEISASVMLGRQINMQKARELAMAGDMEGYAIEITKQAGSAAEFNAMNVFERRALANALGLELTQLSKIVNKEKEAATLAGMIADADASNIIPEASMSKIAETISNIKKFALELVETYGPKLEELFAKLVEPMMSMAEQGVNFLVSMGEGEGVMSDMSGTLGGIVTILGIMATSMILSAIGGIFASFAQIPFGLGIPLAIGSVAIMAGLLSSMTSGLEVGTELGGIQSDGVVRTLHKGETVLNAKDTAMLATSLNAVRGGGTGNTNLERQNREMKEEMSNLRRDMKSYFGAGGSVPRTIVGGFGNAFSEHK